MLKLIPFYGALFGLELANGKTAQTSHVLVYGAIEAHAMGERGCIASDATISLETGLKESSVTTIISLLKRSGWIYVVLSPQNKRLEIVPLVELSVPEKTAKTRIQAKERALTRVQAQLKPGFNIDNREEYSIKEIDKSISKKGEGVVEGYTPKDAELSKLLRELASKKFQYLKIREPTRSHLRAMNRIHTEDGYSYEMIEIVIRWATQDDFWAGVIQSEQGLRRNFNKLLINAERWHKENQRTRTVKL